MGLCSKTNQVWGFGGEKEQLDADDLQLAEKVDIPRLTLQAGRFAVTDFFDNNSCAHDPGGRIRSVLDDALL